MPHPLLSRLVYDPALDGMGVQDVVLWILNNTKDTDPTQWNDVTPLDVVGWMHGMGTMPTIPRPHEASMVAQAMAQHVVMTHQEHPCALWALTELAQLKSPVSTYASALLDSPWASASDPVKVWTLLTALGPNTGSEVVKHAVRSSDVRILDIWCKNDLDNTRLSFVRDIPINQDSRAVWRTFLMHPSAESNHAFSLRVMENLFAHPNFRMVPASATSFLADVMAAAHARQDQSGDMKKLWKFVYISLNGVKMPLLMDVIGQSGQNPLDWTEELACHAVFFGQLNPNQDMCSSWPKEVRSALLTKLVHMAMGQTRYAWAAIAHIMRPGDLDGEALPALLAGAKKHLPSFGAQAERDLLGCVSHPGTSSKSLKM